MKLNDLFNQYFLDNKGRLVYYDQKTRIGYFVPSNKRFIVSILTQRISVSLVISLILSVVLRFHWIIGLGTGLLFLFISEWYFKKVVLKSLSFTPNYDYEFLSKKKISEKDYKKSLNQLILQMVLSVVFIAISYLQQSNQEEWQTILLILTGVGFLILSISRFVKLKTNSNRK